MNETRLIGVVVAEDYYLVRRGLICFLANQPDIEIVGEAQSGKEALQICQQVCPDVVLMDLFMPDIDGITATQMIHNRWPDIHVIALSGYIEKKLVEDVFKAGAIGYLLKDVAGDELVQAIRRAYSGRPTLTREAIQLLIQPAVGNYRVVENLKPNEIDVLGLLVKGMSNLEIARRLGISRSTVILRIKSILSKLGAVNRTEAVAIAIHHHLID